MTEVTFSEAELEAIETLANLALEPGTRCPCCHRRTNKPRKEDSPAARRIRAGYLPIEKAELVEDAIDALQEYVGADPTSYARGEVVEKAVQIALQQREQVKAYFEGTE